MYKIIGVDGKEYGPVTAEQLRQWIAQGRANAQTKVQAENSSEWKTLSAYPEFFSVAAPAPPPAAPPAPLTDVGRHPTTTNGMAVAGFIMGLLAVLLGWACCGLFGVLGIVFSAIGISQINRNPATQTGKGLAIAGLVLSILGVLLYVIIAACFGVLGFIGEALSK